MNDYEFRRRLAIMLMDSLDLSKRISYINDEVPLKDVKRLEKLNYDFYPEASTVLPYLAQNTDSGIIWYGEQGFPDFSPLTHHVPGFIMYKGTRPDLSKPSLALVGTRHASWSALQQAFTFGLECAGNKIVCVTGLAEGVDRSSAEGASALKGCVWGVIGSGLATNYPSFSADIKKRIVENGGAIISRFAPETAPSKYSFPLRNMVISALSDACIVVQAPERSGALITADFSLSMGKDVCVGTTGIGEGTESRGTMDLFDNGAMCLQSLGALLSRPLVRVYETTWLHQGSIRYHDVCYSVEKCPT